MTPPSVFYLVTDAHGATSHLYLSKDEAEARCEWLLHNERDMTAHPFRVIAYERKEEP